MRVGSGLLGQLEKCGFSAKLASEHAEAGYDASGFRFVKIEIGRAYHARDRAQLPEADAALSWLTTEPGTLVAVGESLDLVDQTTGEVLVTGRPGAVLRDPGLVIAWKTGDQFDAPEPDDDLGLVAMGLATLYGQPFRTAHVALRGHEVFPRRSEIIDPSAHPALLERIRAAVGRPRIACPGDWCVACRQAVHCSTWLARAKTALTVFDQEVATTGPDGAPQLELTNDNAGALAGRLKMIEKAADLAKEQLKSFVRHGGSVVVDGKEYYAGSREGRTTADVALLKADGLTKYLKTGAPFESFGWRRKT